MKFKFVFFGLLIVVFVILVLVQSKVVELLGGKFVKEVEQMFCIFFKVENLLFWMMCFDQDDMMKICGQYCDNLLCKIGEQIEKVNCVIFCYLVDGKLIGDWKEGEKFVVVGIGGYIGFIQFDFKGWVCGGNCYVCYQFVKQEVVYGMIGLSLQNFGKICGNLEENIKYVYDKIYNFNVFFVCINMLCFGLYNWLMLEQIIYIVVFLIDLELLVNKD